MAPKVLLIEDSATDAAIVKESLRGEDLEIIWAACGKDGLEKARELKPDLIVLDLVLPDISGFEVCEQIRREDGLKNSMVVILSAKDSMDEISKAFGVGADDYIVKPPIPEFIARKIKLYLGIKQQ